MPTTNQIRPAMRGSTGWMPARPATRLAMFLAAGACGSLALGVPACPPPFPQGANGLFIGHSFFVPVAEVFDRVGTDSGYPLHEVDSVFAGGPAGSPRQLWENEQRQMEIDQKLATGEVQLLAMTSFSESTSRREDYARWIELALSYNPDTVFLIGQPWVPAGPSLDPVTFEEANNQQVPWLHAIVQQLRIDYPHSRIEFVSYGRVAAILRNGFEAQTLPDLTQLVGAPEDALFTDGLIGHGGAMLTELSAVAWIQTLYGAELEDLTIGPWQSDVASIMDDVRAFNEPLAILPADVTADGIINVFDIFAFVDAYGAGLDSSDLNGDGRLDVFDVLVYFELYTAGCA